MALVLLAVAAAGSSSLPGWFVPAITVGGTVLAAVVSGVTALLVKRMSTPAEEAGAGKARAETVAVEVGALREVIGTLQAQQDRDRDRSDRESSRHEKEIAQLQARMDALVAGLELHRDWDGRAARALREIDPEFPAPPPLGVD